MCSQCSERFDKKEERQKLTEALPRRETEPQRLKDTVSNTAAFLDKAKRYTDIQALTPELLRLFIQKIVAHENKMVQTRTTDRRDPLCRHWLHGEQTNSKTGTAQRDPESVLNHSQLFANGKPGWCLKHQPGNPRQRCYPCQGAANGRPRFCTTEVS